MHRNPTDRSLRPSSAAALVALALGLGLALASCEALGVSGPGEPPEAPNEQGLPDAPETWTPDHSLVPQQQSLTLASVVSMTPNENAMGAPLGGAVAIQFGVDMNATSVAGATFQLWKGGEHVAGTVGYDAATRTATFQPARSLAPQTSYTVLLTGLSQADGAPVADVSWTFTTAAS